MQILVQCNSSSFLSKKCFSENAIDWFGLNEMVVNPVKFQSIISSRLGKSKKSYGPLINNHRIDWDNSVTLLGINIQFHRQLETTNSCF